MSVVLDIIVLAIILVTVFLSAKRGFVRVLIELVGFVAAVFISFTISTPLADMTYDKIIEPPIVASVGDVTGDSVGNGKQRMGRSSRLCAEQRRKVRHYH